MGGSVGGKSGGQLVKRRGMLAGVALVLCGMMLTGCSRPGEDEFKRRVDEAFVCKGMEVADINRLDSMPGIYSYVARYNFQYRLTDGDKAAQDFYAKLLELAEVKGDDWKAAVNAPKVQAYLLDECTEGAQPIVESMFEDVLTQLGEKKTAVRLPVAIPVSGWAEFMPGKRGWDITMHRERLGEELVYSQQPVKRDVLVKKAAGSAKSGKKGGKK
ncbi:MAG: hypothetical protein H6R04_1180 [Burkholderiaceae bacterium]|nr:hypothetical protein [Burkholderiaceae bacterium]